MPRKPFLGTAASRSFVLAVSKANTAQHHALPAIYVCIIGRVERVDIRSTTIIQRRGLMGAIHFLGGEEERETRAVIQSPLLPRKRAVAVRLGCMLMHICSQILFRLELLLACFVTKYTAVGRGTSVGRSVSNPGNECSDGAKTTVLSDRKRGQTSISAGVAADFTQPRG